MNQKDLTKTFMMISSKKIPLASHDFHKTIQRPQGLSRNVYDYRRFETCLLHNAIKI